MTMNLFACNRLGALPRELTQRENIMENLCLMIVRLMLAGVCACGAPRAVSQTAASAVRQTPPPAPVAAPDPKSAFPLPAPNSGSKFWWTGFCSVDTKTEYDDIVKSLNDYRKDDSAYQMDVVSTYCSRPDLFKDGMTVNQSWELFALTPFNDKRGALNMRLFLPPRALLVIACNIIPASKWRGRSYNLENRSKQKDAQAFPERKASVSFRLLLREGFGGQGRGAGKMTATASILTEDQHHHANRRIVRRHPSGLLIAGPAADFLQQRCVFGDKPQLERGELRHLGVDEIEFVGDDSAAALLLVMLPSKRCQKLPVGNQESLVANDPFLFAEVHLANNPTRALTQRRK